MREASRWTSAPKKKKIINRERVRYIVREIIYLTSRLSLLTTFLLEREDSMLGRNQREDVSYCASCKARLCTDLFRNRRFVSGEKREREDEKEYREWRTAIVIVVVVLLGPRLGRTKRGSSVLRSSGSLLPGPPIACPFSLRCFIASSRRTTSPRVPPRGDRLYARLADDYYFFRAIFSHEGVIRLAAASARLDMRVMSDALTFCTLMPLPRDTWEIDLQSSRLQRYIHFNNAIAEGARFTILQIMKYHKTSLLSVLSLENDKFNILTINIQILMILELVIYLTIINITQLSIITVSKSFGDRDRKREK